MEKVEGVEILFRSMFFRYTNGNLRVVQLQRDALPSILRQLISSKGVLTRHGWFSIGKEKICH